MFTSVFSKNEIVFYGSKSNVSPKPTINNKAADNPSIPTYYIKESYIWLIFSYDGFYSSIVNLLSIGSSSYYFVS